VLSVLYHTRRRARLLNLSGFAQSEPFEESAVVFCRSSNHPDLGAPSLASETWRTQRSVGASVHRHEVPV